MKNASEKEAIDPALVKFCIDNGVVEGPIAAGFVENGWRGIIATSPIPRDTCILRIPRNLLVSCESARRDETLMSAIAASCALPPTPLQLLVIHLLKEMSNTLQSFWSVYLQSLPQSYTTAISLTDAAVDALQVPYAQRIVTTAHETAHHLYTQSLPALHALNLSEKWTSKFSFFWALSTISSRTMFLPHSNGAEVDQAGCLTPFGDLHNHAAPPPPYTPHLLPPLSYHHHQQLRIDEEHEDSEEDDQITTTTTTTITTTNDGCWGDGAFDAETDCYCIYARREYSPGDEIFLCYGRHPNLQLLEHYGFVLDENAHDVAVLPWAVLPDEVVKQLKGAGGGGGGALPLIHADGNPSFELLRVLRMIGLGSVAERKRLAWIVLEDRKASDKSEKWAVCVLKKACEETLKSLATSLEEDEEELVLLRKTATARGNREDDEGMMVVVEWRRGYKRCLHLAIGLCDAVLQSLRGNDVESPAEALMLRNLVISQPKLLGRKQAAATVPVAAAVAAAKIRN